MSQVRALDRQPNAFRVSWVEPGESKRQRGGKAGPTFSHNEVIASVSKRHGDHIVSVEQNYAGLAQR